MDVLAKAFGFCIGLLAQGLHNYGAAIVLFCFLWQLVKIPIQNMKKKNDIVAQRARKEVEEIREKYKNDQAGYEKAIYEIYEKNKVHPGAKIIFCLVETLAGIGLFTAMLYPMAEIFLFSPTDVAAAAKIASTSTSSQYTIISSIANNPAAFTAIPKCSLFANINFNLFGISMLDAPSPQNPVAYIYPIAAMIMMVIPCVKYIMTARRHSRRSMLFGVALFLLSVSSFGLYLGFPAAVSVYSVALGLFSYLFGFCEKFLTWDKQSNLKEGKASL